jgi:hypothetical protein
MSPSPRPVKNFQLARHTAQWHNAPKKEKRKERRIIKLPMPAEYNVNSIGKIFIEYIFFYKFIYKVFYFLMLRFAFSTRFLPSFTFIFSHPHPSLEILLLGKHLGDSNGVQCRPNSEVVSDHPHAEARLRVGQITS